MPAYLLFLRLCSATLTQTFKQLGVGRACTNECACAEERRSQAKRDGDARSSSFSPSSVLRCRRSLAVSAGRHFLHCHRLLPSLRPAQPPTAHPTDFSKGGPARGRGLAQTGRRRTAAARLCWLAAPGLCDPHCRPPLNPQLQTSTKSFPPLRGCDSSHSQVSSTNKCIFEMLRTHFSLRIIALKSDRVHPSWVTR